MNAKEFAIKYAGRKIRFKDSGYADGNRVLVGYCKDSKYDNIVYLREYGFKQDHNAFIFTAPHLVSSASLLDYSCWDRFEVLPEDKLQVPYPSTCKICHLPARKIAGGVLCSNPRCKTRGKSMKPYILPKIKIVGTGTKEDPVHVVCPLCRKLAIEIHRDHKLRCSIHGFMPYRFKENKYYKWHTYDYSCVKFIGNDWGELVRTGIYGVRYSTS